MSARARVRQVGNVGSLSKMVIVTRPDGKYEVWWRDGFGTRPSVMRVQRLGPEVATFPVSSKRRAQVLAACARSLWKF